MGAGGFSWSNASISEVIVFNRKLTDSEIVLVERYLNKKWKILPDRQINTPVEIPDCALWLDANDRGSISTNATGSVIQWNDKSGNARHVGQASNAIRPTLSASNGSLNNLPTIGFSGMGALTSSTFSSVTSQPMTYFFVTRCENVSSKGLFSTSGGSNTIVQWTATNNIQLQDTVFINVPTPFPTLNVPIVLTVQHSNTNASARFNGIRPQVPASVGAALTITSFNIGTYSGNNYIGPIGEVIAYSRALSDAEITLVEKYLGQKWGFTFV
jgi:hypothetical protein